MYRFVDAATLRLSARPASSSLPTWPDLDGDVADAGQEQVRWLREVWTDASFAAAVDIASPVLAAQVQVLLDTPDLCPRSIRRASVSTLRYLLRSTSRATPFGLFAGIAPLRVADATCVRIGSAHRATARVDHQWIDAAVELLLRCRGLVARLAVVVDGRTFVRDGRLVLSGSGRTAATSPPGDAVSGGVPVPGVSVAEVSVRLSAPVAAVLRHARTSIVFDRLRERIADEFPDASADAVDRMLAGLVAESFLVTELQPPMTSTDPITHLIECAAGAGADRDPAAAAVVEELRAIRHLLDRHDAAGEDHVGTTRREMRKAVVTRMRGLAGTEKPLGVDLRVDAEVSVPGAVAVEAATAAAALVRLAPEPGGAAAWRDYHRRFLDHYGIGAMVALPELLHSGTGLGYPAGYRDTCLPGPATRTDAHTRRRAALLTRLTNTAAWERRHEVELTDADLDALDGEIDLRPQPHTELRVEVHAPTRVAVDQGRFGLLVVGASRAAGTVTGRFLDLLDPDEQGRITAALRDLPTVTDGAVRVQLSGPPLNRGAATITRDMTTLSRQVVVGGHPPAGSMQPGDLAVSADTAGLYLVIAATGSPVEPTAFTALELVRCADPTLRFLCEIATSACTPCQPFTWDPALSELPHLPRVRYRRTVLSPARWTVRATDLAPGTTPAAWRAWRDRWAVPDRVQLVQHDRRLRLDLTERAHLHLLNDALTRHGHLTLFEAPAPDAFGWIDDHAHELVLPLATTTRTRHPARPRPTTSIHSPTGSVTPPPRHAPGVSEWLFARLACHPDHQHAVLTAHLPRLLAEIAHVAGAGIGPGVSLGNGLGWWFLRLVDPDHHLRLRIRLATPRQFGDTAACLAAWANRLTAAGLVGDLQLDTYRPETGRFGHGTALRAAETVFAADSTAAIAQLTLATVPASVPGADQAVTAASMLDLVTAFSATPDGGRQWLIRHAPRTFATPPGRDLRIRTLHLADPGHRAVAAMSGGDRVLAAWDHRRAALSAYRAALVDTGIEPETVLADLLHLHHTRVAGPQLDREGTCLTLARAAALSQHARTTGHGPAA